MRRVSETTELMSNTTAYLIQIPEAERLASLIGIKSDLERVLRCCDRMMDRYSGPHLKKDPFDIVGFTTPLDLRGLCAVFQVRRSQLPQG